MFRFFAWGLFAAVTTACTNSTSSPDAGPSNGGTSAGWLPDASAGSGGSSGSGGDAGSGSGRDLDATSPEGQVDGSTGEGPCLLGALDEVCGASGCPALDVVVDELRSDAPRAGTPQLIVRRNCQAEDGTAMVSVGYPFGLSSMAFVYEASSEQLVTVVETSDYNEFCDGTAFRGYFGSARASTGALVVDCGFDTPTAPWDHCPLDGRDAGATPDAGEAPDAGGTPDDCVFVE